MAAITPGKRAPRYQWGQQSVLCLCWGDNTLTPNSVNQPSGFSSNGKDSQIKSFDVLHARHCAPRRGSWRRRGGAAPSSKANTGADGSCLFSSTLCVVGVHVLFWLRDHLLCVGGRSLILNSALQKLRWKKEGWWEGRWGGLHFSLAPAFSTRHNSKGRTHQSSCWLLRLSN